MTALHRALQASLIPCSCVAEDASADALEGESTGKDLAEDRRDVADAHDDDHDAGQDIENRHEGHHERGDLADALDAAEGNEGDDHGDQDAGDQRGDAEEIVQGTGDLTALGDVADAEGGKAAQETENDRHPAPVFAIQSGIRQGCLLLTLLFNIILEILPIAIR